MSTLDDRELVGRLRSRSERLIAPETERDRERRRIVALVTPFLALAVVGAFVPLVYLVRMSLSESSAAIQGLQFGNFRTLALSVVAYLPVVGSGVSADPIYGEVVWNSLWFGAATTVVSVAVGIAIAHGLENYDLPREGLLVTLISFPISLPGIVVAFMIMVWFARTGVLTNFFAAIAGMDPVDLALTGQPPGTTLAIAGLFLGYCYSMIPRATFLLRGSYAEVNTDAEEAARALGATPWETFRYVTFPQIRPGVVGALILTFRTALAIFGTVLVLKALSVITFRFQQELSTGWNLSMASALAVAFFAFTLVFTFVGLRYTSAEVAS
ncbi:ABC transporter permease [Halosimplex pelagicum]|uniref:ABC transporter permease subunit n=1 Tax=Halosimplex pelagicum TaxID=869886 RepID=A0A7D5P4G1_9EURY|nr:ABC transporter permease subunit [Halosimplex pelagicum]QLH80537.1 ABC transporter permease subunit [Halosimplex pelagicum]